MFKDEETRKFFLYAIGTGFFVLLMACITLTCLLPGNEENCIMNMFTAEPIVYEYDDPPEYALVSDVDYRAVVKTTKGDFVIDLFEENAPNTVNNFVFLAENEYYEDVKIHRVFRDFLFQTGSRLSLDKDPSNDGLGGPGYFIEDEVNWDSLDFSDKKRSQLTELGYKSVVDLESMPMQQYSVAMANEQTPNTNGSQFFVVIASNDDTRLKALEGLHTVFGKVISGFDVIEQINKEKLDEKNPEMPFPKKAIRIDAVEIMEIKKASVGT
jgi:cyclophilin family peptidyl-prolyl cis-trans isomerase